MKKEFFGRDESEALAKAAGKLGLAVEKIKYRLLEEQFGHPLKFPKVGIVVDVEEGQKQETKTTEGEIVDLPATADPVKRATELVDGIVGRMGIKSKTQAAEKGKQVILSVRVLDGKLDLRRGDSRELRGALQFLVNRMVVSGSADERRFVVDIGEKLKERSEQMMELAMDLVREVKKLGRPIHIKLMDSQDRRLLHEILGEQPTVTTASQGLDRFRILMVASNTAGGK